MFIPSLSSGELTSDQSVYAGKCYLASVLIITDGANDATVVLYDGADTTGSKRYSSLVSGANNYGGRTWNNPVTCNNGIYLDITGTNASVIIEYIVR